MMFLKFFTVDDMAVLAMQANNSFADQKLKSLKLPPGRHNKDKKFLHEVQVGFI